MQPDPAPAAASDNASLTDYVAGFVVATRANDISDDVMHLGTRSVIDGLGLALAGAASQTGVITRVISPRRHRVGQRKHRRWQRSAVAARFAAFANGVSIHADELRRHAARGREGSRVWPLTHPRRRRCPGAGSRRARPAQRSRPDDGYTSASKSMQSCGSDPAASLPAGLPQHRDVRRHRRRCGGREAAGS